MNRRIQRLWVARCPLVTAIVLLLPAWSHSLEAAPSKAGVPALELELRRRLESRGGGGESRPVCWTERWEASRTVMIICDMWNDHTCKGAAGRVAEMAPAINETAKAARDRGILIIHAPSGTTAFYKDTPQRRRAMEAPFARAPVKIQWNYWNTEREGEPSKVLMDGGCACPKPCFNFVEDENGIRTWKRGQPLPWSRQIGTIDIAPDDVISDDGQEIYNLMEARGIENVILTGVHANICVSGRPFGLRQMVYLGKKVVLCRDLTDALIQSRVDGVDQFQGNDLVVKHIEETICPSITSRALTGKPEFRFSADSRGKGSVAERIALEVRNDGGARRDAIVDMPLPAAAHEWQQVALVREGTGRPVPAQVDRAGGEARLVWIVRGELRPEEVRRYELSPAEIGSHSDVARVTRDEKRLVARVGSKTVFVYNHATVPSPDPAHPYYARSGYIHPLYNPSGQVISDDFNPDHAHQHGIMMAWHEMRFEGRRTDGWEQKEGLGRVEHVEVESFGGGPVFGFFTARLRHVDLTAPGGPKTMLDETWRVRVYAFEEPFVFDLVSVQSCASTSPVTIQKIYYGGMAVRGHARWHEDHSYDFLTSEGKSKSDGNQTRPNWVDLFGPVEGRMTGVMVMDHPENFRFPQPVRLHPTMPYFCFAPEALDAFAIAPGKPHVSRYRFRVHDGRLDPAAAGHGWRDYSDPVAARVAE